MQNPVKTEIHSRQTFFLKMALGGLGILAILFLSLGLNWAIFKGDIFQGGTPKSGTAFYIPDYTAQAWATGDIQIFTDNQLQNIAGISFTLVYNADKISIAPENNLVAPGFDFVDSNITSPGRLKIIAANGNLNGITINAGDSLLTLKGLTLSSNLANGEVLNLSVENFELASSVNGNVTSGVVSVTAGKITIGSNGTLKLLSAKSLDTNTLKLSFSDYLTAVGTFTLNNGLTIMNAVIDPADSKAIKLTTGVQTQGTLYTVSASGTLGNTAGALDSRYQTAYFTGKGTIATPSNFNLTSAQATSTTGATLTFSETIQDGSVYKDAFSLKNTVTGETLNLLTATKISSNTVKIELTGTILFEANKNYLLRINNSGLPTDMRRAADQALLGQNLFAFPWYSTAPATNQLRVTSATAIAANQVVVEFSENLAAMTVNPTDFLVQNEDKTLTFNVTQALNPYNGSYAKALLTLDQNLIGGKYNFVSVANLNAYSGNLLGSSFAAVFVGYGTYADTSALALTQAVSNSATQVTLSFNQALLGSTVTPVNFEILPSSGTISLNISSAVLQGTQQVILTTAVQSADQLYTVIAKADKIQDQSGKLISSDNTGTFGWFVNTVPIITQISPNQITNDKDQTITILGGNFETGTEVYLDSLKLSASVTPTQITATVTKGQPAKVYTLILKRPNGEQIKLENALVIDNAVQTLTILNTESYASPYKVPNDGATKTTLWVRVEDPKGVSDLEKVTLDLRPLQGSPSTIMTVGQIVDNKIWYSFGTTIPKTVATSTTPVTLAVTAENKSGNKAFGTVELMITNDVTTSIPPRVEQAYATPSVLRSWSGGTTNAYFYAYVTDDDGISTVQSVVIDLGPIGGWPTLMQATAAPTGSGAQTNAGQNFFFPKALASFETTAIKSQWYQTGTPFQVPKTVQDGTYDLKITATDQTGETGSATFKVTVSKNINAPILDDDKIYATPRNSIPNDGKTKFAIQAYVEDKDGLSDITSVTLDLKELYLPPLKMTAAVSDGFGAWFGSPEITVPKEAIKGYKKLFLTAIDRSGAIGESNIEIEVTNVDELSEPPEVQTDRSYTTPSVVLNDEKTKLTLYAFIADKELDFDYVVVNLSNVAKYVGTTAATGSGAAAATACKTNSDSLVCMFPSLPEGNEGQWFVLPDVVVLKTTAPGVEPYRVWVTAVDKKGNSSQGYLNINVTDGSVPIPQTGFPTLVLATAVSPTTVEAVFSNPLAKSRLNSKGSDFKITQKNNTSAYLDITNAYINTEGTIVTLTTASQVTGTKYTLSADAKKLGLKDNRVSDTIADFTGFQEKDVPPQIDTITAKSSYQVEISFSNALKPTSLDSSGADFEIFTATGQPQTLKTTNAQIVDANTVLLSTEAQISNQKYRLRVFNLTSAAGRPVKKSGLTTMFKGFNSSIGASNDLQMRADFNGDGKVDFTDFTMFSAVYGSATEQPPATWTGNISIPYQGTEPTSPVPY